MGPGQQGKSPVGVLKYRFCYYSGIARPTEPKMTLEKIVAVPGRRGQDVMLGLGQEAGGWREWETWRAAFTVVSTDGVGMPG